MAWLAAATGLGTLAPARGILAQPVGSGGYVRAELRGEADPTNPAAGRLDMEALTNPIFLVSGTQPEDNEPVDAPRLT